eukprot:scaffold795_cov94-Skeletonema_dohrnii-CCMP3373.AAC.1
MVRILELEVQAGVKEAGKASRARPTIHSLAGRLLKVREGWKKQGMADLDVENKIHLHAVGFRKGQQNAVFRSARMRNASTYLPNPRTSEPSCFRGCPLGIEEQQIDATCGGSVADRTRCPTSLSHRRFISPSTMRTLNLAAPHGPKSVAFREFIAAAP